MFLKCCDCGCVHRVNFEWPENAIIMKWIRRDNMSYDEVRQAQKNKIIVWAQDWISDWLGLIDLIAGILTLTGYYPNLQGWWLKKWSRPEGGNDGQFKV